MIAPGLANVEAQLWIWLIMMIRPGAAFLAAPVFGARAVPVQVRLILSLAIGIAALGSVQVTLPEGGIATFAGILLVAGEVLAGLALGFAIQIGYSAAFIGGETIANAMGLGFAQMVDPQSGASSPILGQFLSILATFILLSINGHLLLAQAVVDSYRAIPPGGPMLSNDAVHGLLLFASSMFAAGLSIALPVGFALVLIQLIMGMLARSAPSLNLFAVGLPVALVSGLILMAMAAPVMAQSIVDILQASLEQAQLLAQGR